jgi:hypothetical protein
MLPSSVFHIKTCVLHRADRTVWGMERRQKINFAIKCLNPPAGWKRRQDYLKIMASLYYNLNGTFSIPRPLRQPRFLLRAKLPTSG